MLLILAEFSQANETLEACLSPVSFLNSTVGRGIFSLYLGSILFDPDKVWDLILAIVLASNGGFNIAVGLCGCDDSSDEENLAPKALEGASRPDGAAFIPPSAGVF